MPSPPESSFSALRFDDEDFESLFVRHPSPSMLVDGETNRILAANAAAEALYGWTQAELADMTIHQLRVPAERATLEAELARAPELERSHRLTTRHGTRDGTPIDVEILIQPMRLGGRAVRRAVIVDVSARVRAETLFHGVAEQAITGIYVIQDGRFVYLNPRLAEMFGYTVDEVMAQEAPLLMLPPEVREEIATRSAARQRGDMEPLHYSLRSARRDGSPVQLEIYGTRIDLDGRHALLGTVLDTTQRAAADAALRESESRFRGAFDQALTGMAITAPDGRWVRVNSALCDMLGYTYDEMTGRTFQSLTHPDDLETNLALRDALLRGEIPGYRMEKRYMHRDGGTVWAALHVSAVRDREGAVLYLVAQMHDLTSRKRAEAALDESAAQLRHAQKMEAVGRLAGGVAHDFNNLLTVIGSNAEIGEELSRVGRPTVEEFSEIRRAVDRAAALTRQLLAFSRRQVLAPAPLAINEVVADAERMLRRLIGEDVTLETALDERAGEVLADRGQLEQVLMNLVVNARDAMPGGGRILIRTQRDGTGHIAIAVTDNGTGMDEATRARAFEPFFTTKEMGKGTGLGLSTVYGIAQQSGGDVTIESAPSRGTTVTVTLPMCQGGDRTPTPLSVPAIGSSPIEPTDETILLVEDEPGVRAVARKILSRLGYQVIEAANGADALYLWSMHRARIRLVLTDAVMPLMGGRELAERLGEVGADIPVLFMSGYADAERGGVVPPHAHFIAKPFTAEGLRDQVAALIRLDAH